MDDFELSNIEEKIESVILTIMHNRPDDNIVAPSVAILTDLENVLNELFKDSKILCTNAIYTINTDKPFFGVMVNPVITGVDAMKIIATDEIVNLNKYQIELDSKLFTIGLEAIEIASIIIFEISSLMASNGAVEAARAIIDLNNLKDDDTIYIRDSANYTQLIIYALKDTLYKTSSIMFKTDVDEIIGNQYIQLLDLQDEIISAQQKVSSSVFGSEDTLRDPKASVMNWMLLMYKDMKHNMRLVKETLRDAKDFTGSRLLKAEIDATIDSVDKIGSQIVIEGDLNSIFESTHLGALNELSLFQSLKRSGLRSIEDSYYEYALMVKNCTSEDDAIYILHCINTRLGILEDYLYNNKGDISENEKKHWEEVVYKYRALRNELAKKKMKKNPYGIYFDYSQLDYLDSNSEEE